ncbi:hypothetical protein [Micromonospora sp. NPDC005174]|uniref:hypothetical protein n=1 Tax=Micromonospora sp. NPDC005174 TaxID=3157018 RepID=UPI00339F94C8
MTDTIIDPFHASANLAPAPKTREAATREAWIRHYAAEALAAHAKFRAEISTLPHNPAPGSRPDIGYLILAATSATAAAVALTEPTSDAPELIWDLSPELGALNGEWEEWLVDVLVRYGVNPGHIDPAYSADDFEGRVQS